MERHHDVRAPSFGDPRLQHMHNIGMSRQPAHRLLFAEKPDTIDRIIGIGAEHLDSYDAIEGGLSAAVHHTEPATTGYSVDLEPLRPEFRDHVTIVRSPLSAFGFVTGHDALSARATPNDTGSLSPDFRPWDSPHVISSSQF